MEIFREIEPHPALTPFVDRFWLRAGMADAGSAPSTILPDGCIDLMVDLDREHFEVVGTMTRASVLEPVEPMRLVAVRFRPGGASPFLRVPAHELTDRVIDPRDLGSRWLASLRIDGALEPLTALDLLERALLARLPEVGGPEPMVRHAVAALFGPAPPSIARLARKLGCSRQHLGRVFRSQVGIAPVHLARVARLQRAVVALQDRDGQSFAEAAQHLGYFDQAHLTRVSPFFDG